MEVADIVLNYILQNGFNGLYNSDLECGCCDGEFFSCGDLKMECSVGYIHKSAESCPPDCKMNCFDNREFDVYHCDKKPINQEEGNERDKNG